MVQIASSLALIIAICAMLFAATCAVVCWRLRSEFSSVMKASRASAASVVSFDSRVKTLEERWESTAKRVHLNARRDPVTGKSLSTKPETKEDVRRRLGLVGANAARVAHAIHSTGGLKQ